MFLLLGFVFFGLGCIPLFLTLHRYQTLGRRRFRKRLVISVWVVIADLAVILAFNMWAHLYTEYLWFEALSFEGRFWAVLKTQALLFCGGAGVSFVFVFFNIDHAFTRLTQKRRRVGTAALSCAFALCFGLVTAGLWHRVLLYTHQVAWPLTEPIFGRSVSFYLFSLPLYSLIAALAIGLVAVTLGFIAVLVLSVSRGALGVLEVDEEGKVRARSSRAQVLLLLALISLVLAWNSGLGMYRLLYSSWGAVSGAGYVDAHFRTFGYWAAVAIYLAAGVLLLAGAFSARCRSMLLRTGPGEAGAEAPLTGKALTFPAVVVGMLALFVWIIPLTVLGVVVKPNEITMEKPYIAHSIRLTRYAYAIQNEDVEKREYQVGQKISPPIARRNTAALKNVRLWDARALLDNLRQQQEIRLYYEFANVDVDRYQLDGEYRQTMLAVRELEKSALDPESQTWVSRHLKYTHGYGAVLLPVRDFLAQGRPRLLVRNIPAESELTRPRIIRPGIYYGERTHDHVYALTTEKELDYPAGEQNVYTSYTGRGGVQLDTLLKKLAFAWKFDGHRLLFSGYFEPRSRVLFRRQVRRRLSRVAPFLRFDHDPYAVITDDGRIKYIVDAYTVSRDFPYSQSYRGSLKDFHTINYLRNSVKAVVDAYDGTVRFYVVDREDVMLQTYRRVFPNMFLPLEDMPADLRRHMRYPRELLTVQAEMYSTYQMDEPEVFYQREDVWEFATERYRESFQPVVPYYVMVQFPGEDDIEFVLMIPFTPRNKNVTNAWMAGRCDPPHYGGLKVFTFPKGVGVLGPRQIEARIDQDTEMSEAMTLWDQRGSSVIRGNLLAIPLFADDTVYILYAEPVYIQAEDAHLPEIKRVVLADQDQVVWGENFEDALARLTGEARVQRRAPAQGALAQDLAKQAMAHFNNYKQLMTEGRFAEAGGELQRLGEVLRQLSNVEEQAR